MSVVRERVVLRRSRKAGGERLPHRVKLDKVSPRDSLIVEVVFNKKNDIRKCFRFKPKQLSERKAVTFTVSGSEVYWLRGLEPERIDPADLPENPKQSIKKMRKGRKPQTKIEPHIKPEHRVLVFDSEHRLDSIYRNSLSASKATHIRSEFLENLCKTKKPSKETGLSFRYLREKFASDERIRDFSLTLCQYDDMCRRQPKQKNIDHPLI